MSIIIVILIILFVLLKRHILIEKQFTYNPNTRPNKQLKTFMLNNGSIAPDKFLALYHQHKLQEFQGCYVIHNLNKDIYYVGQSINVIHRVVNHMSGRGNSSVYVDYLNHNDFRISVIPLVKSNYTTLNSLERNLISAYDAYYHGYNKTRGNKG